MRFVAETEMLTLCVRDTVGESDIDIEFERVRVEHTVALVERETLPLSDTLRFAEPLGPALRVKLSVLEPEVEAQTEAPTVTEGERDCESVAQLLRERLSVPERLRVPVTQPERLTVPERLRVLVTQPDLLRVKVGETEREVLLVRVVVPVGQSEVDSVPLLDRLGEPLLVGEALEFVDRVDVGVAVAERLGLAVAEELRLGLEETELQALWLAELVGLTVPELEKDALRVAV